MRSDRMPTCTSGDRVSPSFLACVLMTSALRSAVIDIVQRPSWSTTFMSAGSALQSGQVEHALGDDFATVHCDQSNQRIRGRYVDRPTDDRSVPSAHKNGLTPLAPGHIGPADG